jgi:hypothetical protein
MIRVNYGQGYKKNTALGVVFGTSGVTLELTRVNSTRVVSSDAPHEWSELE